jgi:5'-3' exonuclease
MANTTIDTDGYHCGGIIGSLMSLKSVVKQFMPIKIYVCHDGINSAKHRKSVNEEYKTGRIGKRHSPFKEGEYNKESPTASFDRQIMGVKQLIELLPVYRLEQDELEADDIISFLWNYHSNDYKIIVSADKDFIQLVDGNTTCYNPLSKKTINIAHALDVFGIHPLNFAQSRAIIGDASDNLKGIKGIAEKTLVKMFPFVAEELEYPLDYFFEWADEQGQTKGIHTESIIEKYCAVYQNEKIIRNNFSIMELKSNRQATGVANMIHHLQTVKLHFDMDIFVNNLIAKYMMNREKLMDWFVTFNKYSA